MMEVKTPSKNELPWSEMDLWELRTSLEYGSTVGELARFMMRSENSIRGKMDERGMPDRKWRP